MYLLWVKDKPDEDMEEFESLPLAEEEAKKYHCMALVMNTDKPRGSGFLIEYAHMPVTKTEDE